MIKKRFFKGFITLISTLLVVLALVTFSVAGVTIIDSRGRQIIFDSPPQRVVSTSPAATEIICNLGVADALVGVNFHDSLPRQKNGKIIVGGFSHPNLEVIENLNPDLVFVSDYQAETIAALEKLRIKTVCLDANSYDQAMENIQLVADIFAIPEQGKKMIAEIQDRVDLIAEKVSRIDPLERKRVFRLMGRERVMTPTANSLLNHLVVLAGGIPMAPEGDGTVTDISLEQWQLFNPQVVFGCGGDREAAKNNFDMPGWKDVDAVKNNRILYFPCALTCRVASYTGYFVEWLAASIYNEEFFKSDNQVYPDAELTGEPVFINQSVVKESWRKTSRIADFKHKTLVVDFTAPQDVLSTLEGFKTGVTTVANHYLPPPSWSAPHGKDLESFTSRILKTLGRNPATSAMLMTGANMDNLTITDKEYKEMKATALVTAGATSNAQRASRSTGYFYEPGTINIILITNMELTPRAMARAIISITEGKSAAMADLDIRSSDDPLNLQATGTGTDNIIVVKGQGKPLDSVGGHTKMGELIAKAVYDGVKQAIFLQNGILASRDIFQRLDERNISLHTLAESSDCQWDKTQTSTMAAKLEALLLQPEYAGLVEQAFALCDARERGLLNNLSAFSFTVNAAAQTIAKKPVDQITAFESTSFLPDPLKMVFNALMSGILLGQN